MKKSYIIGIDEAGRGPWAGPLIVGGWMSENPISESLIVSFPGLTDSKLLTSKKREMLYKQIFDQSSLGKCHFVYAERSAEEIDILGIREANRLCMQEVLLELLRYKRGEDTLEIYIDGCDNYIFSLETEVSIGYSFQRRSTRKTKQKDIHLDDQIKIYYQIGGDRTNIAISAASIIAKVIRDRIMCDFHAKFPLYGFDSHKGYGTRKHHDALMNYDISPIHRKSYEPVKRLISDNS